MSLTIPYRLAYHVQPRPRTVVPTRPVSEKSCQLLRSRLYGINVVHKLYGAQKEAGVNSANCALLDSMMA